MFWNTVLWRIFGTKEREVLRGWRKLYNEGLANLNSSTNVTRYLCNVNQQNAPFK
jgi:hypothetical protein